MTKIGIALWDQLVIIRYFLLELGFCLYYILHHYEVVGQIHSTLYSIHESDPAATPSSKKILIEEIEESPFSKIV